MGVTFLIFGVEYTDKQWEEARMNNLEISYHWDNSRVHAYPNLYTEIKYRNICIYMWINIYRYVY